MPTESVSRDGVRDGIYLVVRSAALEPRAVAVLPVQRLERDADRRLFGCNGCLPS